MSSAPVSTLEQLDRAHLIHPITEFRVHEKKGPRIAQGGKGIRLELTDGSTAIDGLSGLWNISVGHGRTEIADAVAAQMRRMAYYPSFWDFSNEPAIRLGERLASLFPADRQLDHFLFTTGGSEANEINFRIARLYHAVRGEHERKKVLTRRWSYHGITRAAGSATTLPAYHAFYEPEQTFVTTSMPYCFRCEFKKSPPDCEFLCAEDVEQTIKREGAETIAALIAEPVQGTGGILVPPPEYFGHLREICDRHGVLLILDEVITGFGRTGRWFGMEHSGVKPDLVSFAKGITSGYLPLGGVALRRGVYETIRDQSPKGLPFMGGLTYNNHPSSCAAALANLDIIEREGLVENAREVGAYLLTSLRQALGDHPFVAEIRGIGMMAAVEFTAPETKDPVGGSPMVFTSAISTRCWEKRLIARAIWENIALAPPLCTTRSEVDEIVGILSESAREVAEEFPGS